MYSAASWGTVQRHTVQQHGALNSTLGYTEPRATQTRTRFPLGFDVRKANRATLPSLFLSDCSGLALFGLWTVVWCSAGRGGVCVCVEGGGICQEYRVQYSGVHLQAVLCCAVQGSIASTVPWPCSLGSAQNRDGTALTPNCCPLLVTLQYGLARKHDGRQREM
jgi:hypothetical protein